jgi:hypothetical protein
MIAPMGAYTCGYDRAMCAYTCGHARACVHILAGMSVHIREGMMAHMNAFRNVCI